MWAYQVFMTENFITDPQQEGDRQIDGDVSAIASPAPWPPCEPWVPGLFGYSAASPA